METNVETLGDLATLFSRMKDAGWTHQSVEYALRQVWGEVIDAEERNAERILADVREWKRQRAENG